MGSSGQLYSLSWGEFGTSLASAVQLLRGHGDLVDVTLAAGGRSFPAHKIVLSAASPFLLDLLKSTPCQHPVVMLAGISSDDLESLLEFVYRGEVSVESSQLPSLLQAAHCLSIHGLTPPTILTENGEEVPVSAIPTNPEPVTREIMNSCIPIHRRKKRRKSSSSCSKWPKMDNATDNDDRHDGHNDDDRTNDYDHKHDDGSHADDAHEHSEQSNHRGSSDWPNSMPQPPSSLVITEVSALSQEPLVDTKPTLHTLMAMQQQYSPLHIPSFPGSLNIGLPPGYPLLQAPTSTSSTLKVRGASDCPGICPLCGATLRQARNLRRHLLSSCKYRLNSFHTPQAPSDQMIVEIKPEIEIGAFNNTHNHAGNNDNNSGSSSSNNKDNSSNAEQIICHPSPLPSPTHGSSVVTSHQSVSETIAR